MVNLRWDITTVVKADFHIVYRAVCTGPCVSERVYKTVCRNLEVDICYLIILLICGSLVM